MKNLRVCLGLCLALFGTVLCVQAATDNDRCENVSGRIFETVVSGIDNAVSGIPNLDPIPRVLGNVTGVLEGSATSIITSLVPIAFSNNVPTVLNARTVDIFLTKSKDLLYAGGQAVFTQLNGQPPGNFADKLTLTISGGTGRYAGATGTINVTGEGHNVFDPTFGAGFFVLTYKGQVCGVTD